jgi:flagellar protein FlbT
MPLKLKLAAHERLIVNGAVLINGDFRTSLLVRNFAHVMREKDVLQEADANTPTKRLYFLVQTMLMQPPPSDELMSGYREAHRQLTDAYVRADNLDILHEVDRLVGEGDFYKALARLHPLIAYEADLLKVEPHRWRRTSQGPAAADQRQGQPPRNGRPGPAPT